MKFILLAIAFITFTSFGQTDAYKKMLSEYYDGFPTISPAEAKKKVGNEKVYFLDTREWSEYKVSHIKGARFVGYDKFSMDKVSKIPKDAEVIVYCSVGARSQTIGKKLKKAGYTNVKNLYGGLFLWANKGYPMVDTKKDATERIHGYSKEWGKWVTKGTVVY